MSTEILMPALSPTMTEGNLSKWLIKKGDTIKAGDLIAEIETDKATMEVEAVDEGVVLDLLFKEGEANIPVNKAIAIIGDPNEKVEVKKESPIEKVIEEKKIDKNIETKIENKKADIIDTPSPKIEEDRNLSSEEITMRQALRDTLLWAEARGRRQQEGGGQGEEGRALHADDRLASWRKGPSTLLDDPALSARLVPAGATAAPTHPGAPPEQLGSLPWPQGPASGRPTF